MHTKQIAHRDMRTENVLLVKKTKEPQLKVIDFGCAKSFADTTLKTKHGEPYYVAPEVLGGRGYNEKCDIWSCGVILYIMISGYPPFYGDKDEDILRRVVKGYFDFPDQEWDCHPEDVKEFIGCMLTLDPAKRLSADRCKSHKWVSKYR